jgi:hypothetical protein
MIGRDRREYDARRASAYEQSVLDRRLAFAVLLTTSRAIENPDGFIVSGCLSLRPSWR